MAGAAGVIFLVLSLLSMAWATRPTGGVIRFSLGCGPYEVTAKIGQGGAGEVMSELSNRDLQEIRDLHDRWIARELERDVLGVLRLCTDDVQWLLPNSGLLVGKEAAQELLAEPGVEIREVQTADIRIRGSASFAYKTSTYSTRYAAAGSSEVRVTRGTHLWILRKTDAKWQVALVTWQPAITVIP